LRLREASCSPFNSWALAGSLKTMVSIVAPSLWQVVYEQGVKHGRPGMFYYCMALVTGAKLLLSFVFLNGTRMDVGDAPAKSKAG
jgi:hypothetical protein